MSILKVKPLSKVKKDPRAAHFWFLFPIIGSLPRKYGVSIGPPNDPDSKLVRYFTSKDDLKDWIKYDLSEVVSPDHVYDLTRLKLIPNYYTQWYVDNIMRG